MLSVLLVAINAKYIHSNLAVYSLRAYADRYLTETADIRIGEYTINQPLREILAKLYLEKPDVLCFSCYIWNITYAQELAEEFHKLCPQVPIWMGGPEVSYEAGAFLRQHPAVTGVMAGEGEQTFLELCEYYARIRNTGEKEPGRAESIGKSPGRAEGTTVAEAADRRPESVSGPGKIAGLIYRDGEEIRITRERGALDMDCLPFCYGDPKEFSNRIVYYESSRGCPFRCSYCLSSVEKCLRFRSMELVERELLYFLENRTPQVKFVDRTFNCMPERAMRIWRFIREHDNGVTNFHFEIAADLMTDEMSDLLEGMRPGQIQFEIGVQSANPATIAEIRRTMHLERVKEIAGRLLDAGRIHIHLDLIAGLPFEGPESFAASFDEIYAVKPDQLQLGFLKVLKGSYLYEHREEYGILCQSSPPYEVMETAWLTYGELLRIRQAEEMLEIYYNSGQYVVSMKLLETQYQSPFVMYQKLGAFCDINGYSDMSHSRIRRAEILLEFVRRETPGVFDLLKEGLIIDLYGRENCRSRPDWADDPAEWKDISRSICGRDRQQHVERVHYRFPDRKTRTLRALPARQEEPLYVRFDYSSRDPVSGQVFWEYCTGEQTGVLGVLHRVSDSGLPEYAADGKEKTIRRGKTQR